MNHYFCFRCGEMRPKNEGYKFVESEFTVMEGNKVDTRKHLWYHAYPICPRCWDNLDKELANRMNENCADIFKK